MVMMYYNDSELVGPTPILRLYLFIKNTINNIEIPKKGGKTNVRQKKIIDTSVLFKLNF